MKYFANVNPLLWKVKSSSSWLWKGIMKGLVEIRKYSIWEVRDGSHINIWNDLWIPNASSIIHLHTPSPTNIDTNLRLVSQLFNNDMREWDPVCLASLFDGKTQIQILNVRNPSTGTDQFKWTLTPSGHFSVKSLYKALTNETSTRNMVWDKIWG
ncbi:hypothetical protein BVC80_9037g32 [Macleaya cordata]|uniref:Reverse transcriptase zinc-binding domain n=1 Tax=Macleaya cordata TaxID=56857 RepID=A0A200Q5M1_MACCD|nr:hypothetical protein BVC80_9037g32 [Macleaya cordata]